MAKRVKSPELRQVGEFIWEIGKTGGMRVPGRVYADERLVRDIRKDNGTLQVANVAYLPGIVGYSLAMPDIHWGYGFPIGGVAATDPDEDGVISPGGVGYDINCGVRLIGSTVPREDVVDRVPELVNAMFRDVPSGVGSSGAIGKLSAKDVEAVMRDGAAWAVEHGYGNATDLEHTEESGRLATADPAAVGKRAVERGRDQLGTLGSGNHFLEIGFVDEIYDAEAATAFGLAQGTMTLMVHSGSRGLGYQVCDDSLDAMQRAVEKYGIGLPDRQLACAPLRSPEGERYLAGMACAANYAWANRQILMTLARRAVVKVLGSTEPALGLRLVYDVCHNIAKMERHTVAGRERTVCVHRKGATRAFPGRHVDVPSRYRAVGQPVLIPGDMGTESFVCAGTDRAMAETFGSSCHGAGRVMSRSRAKKEARGRDIRAELAERGVCVAATGKGTLAEEMPMAYKDVASVVDVVDRAGLATKVARMRPLGVVKG